MIDFAIEHRLTPAQATREPEFVDQASGRPCHIATIHRHFALGALAANGERVRLEFVQTPRGRLTSREAIQRFVQRLTSPEQQVLSSPLRRVREITAAERELVGAGFEVGGASAAA